MSQQMSWANDFPHENCQGCYFEFHHVKWSKIYDMEDVWGKWCLVKVIEHKDKIEEVWEKFYGGEIPEVIFECYVEPPPQTSETWGRYQNA
jgi:hypothetical protein